MFNISMLAHQFLAESKGYGFALPKEYLVVSGRFCVVGMF